MPSSCVDKGDRQTETSIRKARLHFTRQRIVLVSPVAAGNKLHHHHHLLPIINIIIIINHRPLG